MNATTDNISCLVLCGGAGTRMDRVDKPTQVWHGRPMVDHVLSSVPDDWPKLISANRNLAFYRQRGEVITDAHTTVSVLNRRGLPPSPLLGVLGGLAYCATDWLLIAPGDTPALPTDWWRPLEQAVNPRCPAAVAFDGERQQHLHLILNVNRQTSLIAYLNTGATTVHGWLARIDAQPVRVADPVAFTNVNTYEDLRRT